MGTLLLAAAAFVGSHFALSHPWRASLIERLGAGKFAAVYSLIAIATFLWLVLAWRAAPSGPLWWIAPEWLWVAASLVMLFASVLLAGSLIGNPALPQPGAGALAEREPGGVFAITRHPMMWSFALWSLVHIAVWPTPANAVLTAAVALLALGGAAGQDRRKRREMGESWERWQGRTSFMPFGGVAEGRVALGSAMPGAVAWAGGLAIWLAATWAHPQLVGVWRWF